MNFSKKLLFFVTLLLIIFSIDFSSKYLTHIYLSSAESSNHEYPFGGIAVFQNFFGIDLSLIYVKNKGAAWGSFSSHQLPLQFFRVSVIGVLLYYFFQKNLSFYPLLALGLIIAGALSNVFDFFYYGFVIDMINFTFWNYPYPTFNIADSSIFIGVVIYILWSFFEKEEG
jgi:signal peptidase II